LLLGLLVCLAHRAQHAQQALGHFLLQEIVPELAQGLIELRVAILPCRPDYWLGLAILGQEHSRMTVGLDCSSRGSITGRATVLSMADIVPQQLAPVRCGAYDNGRAVNKFPALASGEWLYCSIRRRCGSIER
jgi:hypothetical protein